jgi:demethylmenaquinone methyltransferase/2-methoxy-6-polyprenyl-1,4-benzoquinol methylase
MVHAMAQHKRRRAAPQTAKSKATKPQAVKSKADKSGDRENVDFGFRRVRETEKPALVRDVFGRVAPAYDLMNDLMSGGLHRLWKRALIDRLNPRPGMRFLDVAGGTGDISFRLLKASGGSGGESGNETGGELAAASHVTVVDATEGMLRVGRQRATEQHLDTRLEWLCGEAERLPLPDCSFDAYTISFGLRNVTRRDAALAEARRVLKPGGHFLCLEFSHVLPPLLNQLYKTYSFRALPFIGNLVAGDKEAYRYLAESISRFPAQEELAAEMREAGLDLVEYRSLSGGIVAIHSAWRT